MKKARVVWIVAAWLAALLALFSIAAILSTFLLVPNNLALTHAENFKNKLRYCRFFIAGLFVLFFVSRMAIQKIRKFRTEFNPDVPRRMR
jgi:hypothetical protein